jgi:hypothetical protein
MKITLLVEEDERDKIELVQKEKENKPSHKIKAKVEMRPLFAKKGKGKESTKSIRIHPKLIEEVERRVKKEDRLISGGSFSGLVEYLIWDHLGRPEEFLEGFIERSKGERQEVCLRCNGAGGWVENHGPLIITTLCDHCQGTGKEEKKK